MAGYSMTSSPRDTSTIEIAVKRVGDNPVTNHIHGLARVGDTLPIDGGYGDFTYVPGDEPEGGPAVALIAGGIGITPLMSMLRADDEAPRSANVTLVYSASGPGEFAFRDDIDAIAAANPRIRVHYTVTRSAAGWTGPPRPHRPGHAAQPRPRPRDALLPLRPRAIRHRRRRGRVGPRGAPRQRPLRALELDPAEAPRKACANGPRPRTNRSERVSKTGYRSSPSSG